MRYWTDEDGTIHIVTRPYSTTLCGITADDGVLAGQVRPSRDGVLVPRLCETCRGKLRENHRGESAQS